MGLLVLEGFFGVGVEFLLGFLVGVAFAFGFDAAEVAHVAAVDAFGLGGGFVGAFGAFGVGVLVFVFVVVVHGVSRHVLGFWCRRWGYE